MTEQEFFDTVRGRYGTRGVRQARQWIAKVLSDIGEYNEDDADFIKKALWNTFLETKRYNTRFTPKKYLPSDS